jgi:hypothetical protein
MLNLPGIHHGDPVGDPCNDPQIVGDEDHGHVELALKGGEHRPPDCNGIIHEIEELFAMARDERPGLINEILDLPRPCKIVERLVPP